ncbi:MAG: tyrosine-type recombinase/integrase, partial [Clostridium perfringens]|nr:tyrosine-type recombinase/integrase [Clostridium perfringens]
NNINKRFKKALIKANLEPKKFHSLRHTYATRLFENDVPLKTVSELLGHSNIQITANTYITVLEDEKKKVINQLDNIFAL